MTVMPSTIFPALLGDLSLREFFSTYWMKAPTLLRPDSLPEPLRVTEDELLTRYEAEARSAERFSTYNATNSALADGRTRLQALFDTAGSQTAQALSELAEKEAFIVRDLAQVEPYISFCKSVSAFWRSPVTLNCYLVRAGADHFPLHQDGHHIFAVQAVGKKRWYLYPPSTPLPMSYFRRSRENADGEQPLVFDVVAGEILYLPVGWRHEAETPVGSSVHFSLGLHPLRYVDLLRDICELSAAGHSPLRDYVPFVVSDTGLAYREGLGLQLHRRFDLIVQELEQAANTVLEYHNNRPNPESKR